MLLAQIDMFLSLLLIFLCSNSIFGLVDFFLFMQVKGSLSKTSIVRDASSDMHVPIMCGIQLDGCMSVLSIVHTSNADGLWIVDSLPVC